MWYHAIFTTYGTWLHGDPRGFRTRHHREHIEGDYKQPPPPGTYDKLATYSKSILKHPPVTLDDATRGIVGEAIVAYLACDGARLAELAVAATHVHLLAGLAAKQHRKVLGDVKRHVWFVLRDRGESRRIWAKGFKVVPIRDQKHWLSAQRYIAAHFDKEAWTWSDEGLRRSVED